MQKNNQKTLVWGALHPWLRRSVLALVALLALWVVLWAAVPPLARWLIERQGTQALGRQVTLERVEFAPWSLQAALRGLRVAGPDGVGTQLHIGAIEVDAAMASVWRLAPVIDSLKITDPVLQVAQLAPGQWDFDDVLERLKAAPEEPEPKTAMPRFALYNLSLQGGQVQLDDRSVGTVQQLRKLHLEVPFLSSFDAARQIKVQPRLAFELNDSAFDTAAQSTPFTDSLQTQARLRIADLDLSHFARYVPASAPLRLLAGRLSADMQVEFAQQPQTQLNVRGTLQLRDVQTVQADGQPWLDVPALDVDVAEFRPLERLAHLQAVQARGLHVRLQRAASGALLIPGVAQAAQTTARSAPEEPTKDVAVDPWRVQLGRFALRDARVDWQDASVSDTTPGAASDKTPPVWGVQQLQAQASDIAWPLTEPVPFAVTADVLRLDGKPSAAPPAHLGIQGRATLERAQMAVSLRGLGLDLARPYLAGVLRPKLSGLLHADLGLAKNGDALAVQLASVTLERLVMHCVEQAACPTLRRAGMLQTGKDSMLELERLELTDSLIDLSRNRIQGGRLQLQKPQLQLTRSPGGGWMFEDWLLTAPKAAAAAQPKAAQPSAEWAFGLGQLQVDGASFALRDQVNERPVALNLTQLQLQAKGLDYARGQLGKTALQLDTRVQSGRTEPGRLRWEGQASMAPQLAVQGKLHAQNLPLHSAEPYVAPLLNVALQRAEGSFEGQVHYQDRAGAPWLQVQGDSFLDELRVRAGGRMVARAPEQPESTDAANAALDESAVGERGQDLLRWKSLGLRGLSLALEPGKPLSLAVQETTLSDFFARIILQEDGRINLQNIIKQTPDPSTASSAEAASTPAPQLRFGPMKLLGGTVHFSDYFIKPNYSIDVAELSGQLSAFASVPAGTDAPVQMADLQLRGRAQGTAQLDIGGKLNPLASPLALDVQAKMRDLELPPLSPYSIKYAGHGIDRGKLSMDVTYQVQPDGKLTASNKLVLHQLAFGEAVQGAPASLPVRLAVALLADRNGVIDVDLPISGSLNDPEFRIGAVIWKILGNLVTKAITAPFSLLAGAFGSADEQGAIAFEPGSAVLAAPVQNQLTQLAQKLNDRPALQVTVTGWAQQPSEVQALKQSILDEQLLAQKRRDTLRAGHAVDSVEAVTDAEYPGLLKKLYQRADFKKPRNVVGLTKDVPPAQMQDLLLQHLELPSTAITDLALARAVAVRDYLAGKQVPLERLFVGASKLQESEDPKWQPKAELSLGAR